MPAIAAYDHIIAEDYLCQPELSLTLALADSNIKPDRSLTQPQASARPTLALVLLFLTRILTLALTLTPTLASRGPWDLPRPVAKYRLTSERGLLASALTMPSRNLLT